MSRPLEPNPRDIELLFAAERQLEPQANELCESIVERARAALPRNPHPRLGRRTRRWSRPWVAAAAGVATLVFAFCAAAFLAGYRIEESGFEAPAARPAPAPSPALPAQAPPADPLAIEPVPLLPRPTPARSVARGSGTQAMAAEVRVLRPAQQALARNDFASALDAIAEHHRRFPSGQLAEEREALRVRALLGLGRSGQARQAAASFGRRFPNSALLGRMSEMLGTPR